MRLKKRLLVALILLLWALITYLNPPITLPIALTNSNLQMVKVVKVIDGDTIEIEGGQKLRYIGIDTPETVDLTKPVQCFGREATEANNKIIGGQEVFLEKDVSETDKYGRVLRYVYLSSASGQLLMVNEYLVKEGYARSSSYPPDIKHQKQLKQAESEARLANKGLWKSCQATTSAALDSH